MSAPAAVPVGYELIEGIDRVSAVDADGVEICGAYQPLGHNYWLLYVTMLATRRTGVRVPHNACFWGGPQGRADAVPWVRTIATLYGQAVAL